MYDILNVYLENGLRVVMHRIPNARTIACGVWVRQGSKHEDEASSGLSHLLEHLMINTDNNMNSKLQQLMGEVTSEGVLYNAGTTKESTSFFFTGLSDSLGNCIKTLASIVIDNNTFAHGLVENEKKVVTQEAISFYSSFNQIKERVSQALWGDIGVGKIIVGNIENIKKAEICSLEKIVQESYTPENSVIVVIGEINYQDTLKLIEDNFSRWEDRKTRQYNEVVDSEPGIYFNKGSGGKSTVISIGFRTPGYMSKNRVYIDVVAKILGDTSLESRMAKEIRVKRGLAYNLGAFASFYENRGTFAFTSVCAKESVEEVIKVAIEEFNKAKYEGFTQAEMDRAKRVLKTSRLLELGDITSQLKFIGKFVSYGHLYSLEQELRNIEKVELEMLNKAAEDIIKEMNLSLAVIGECDIDTLVPHLKIS
ncbi:MAG: insulinase family protein [Clostridia bacterium]|nr:insulinase family protein [Clostridia bacterium]